MDREVISNYSIASSHSQISYIANHHYQVDSNYNPPNLMEILLNLHNNEDLQEETSDNGEFNYNREASRSINSGFFNEINEMSYASNKRSSSSISEEELSFNDPKHLLMNNGAIINNGRAATAPARPMNEIEEFKWTSQFMNLEKAVMYCNRLIVLQPEAKFDVDSEEGSEICKKFLEQLEKLIKVKIG